MFVMTWRNHDNFFIWSHDPRCVSFLRHCLALVVLVLSQCAQRATVRGLFSSAPWRLRMNAMLLCLSACCGRCITATDDDSIFFHEVAAGLTWERSSCCDHGFLSTLMLKVAAVRTRICAKLPWRSVVFHGPVSSRFWLRENCKVFSKILLVVMSVTSGIALPLSLSLILSGFTVLVRP